MESRIIPEHREGKQNDLSFERLLGTREQALDCFKRAWKRLLNPDIWQELTGNAGATVKLFTETGGDAARLAEKGDFLRIDIPGPGPETGSGYDWVQIEEIEDRTDAGAEEELFAMRVHPSPGPAWKSDVAHFFESESSSTFVVQREGNKVIASYHGRNEKPNNETASVLDNVRNTLVAAGAAIGLSEAQWSALLRGLLQDELGG